MSTILFFIKFTNEKYADKLIQNGEVFFSKTKKFADDSNPERGDKYEGSEWVDRSKMSYMKVSHPSFGEKMFNLDPEGKTELIQYNHNYLLYSLFAVTQEDLESIDGFKIDKRILEFGDTAVIIKNTKSFFSSIENELKKQNIKYKYNLVNYKNFKEEKTDINPFIKKIEHKHQCEFRIIIEKNDDNPKIISIGSIENYCEKIPTARLVESEWETKKG